MLEKNKKKKNKGFTLVELIVVIAILAILVGLLAPQYTKYVEKSRKSADINNLNEIVNAIKVAASDPEYNLGSNKQYVDSSGNATGELQDTFYTIVIGIDYSGEETTSLSMAACDDSEQVKKALEEFAGLTVKGNEPPFTIDNVKMKSHKWGEASIKGYPFTSSGIAAQVYIDNSTDAVTVTYSDNVKNYIDHGTIDSN